MEVKGVEPLLPVTPLLQLLPLLPSCLSWRSLRLGGLVGWTLAFWRDGTYNASGEIGTYSGWGVIMSKVLKEIDPPKVRRGNGPAKTAAGYIRGVNQALEDGAHMLARNLSDEGHRAFPENEELAQMARILAPPKVLNAHLPPNPSVAMNVQWVRE